MDDNKKNMLYSYFENGFERGLNVENPKITKIGENSLSFSGIYNEKIKNGYLHNDEGQLQGKVRYVEQGASSKIGVEAHYTGKKDGIPYDYSRTDTFEIYKNGIVYRVSVDSRNKLVKETYYRTIPEDGLCDYITNCSNPIRLSDGDHEIAKVARK